MFSTSGFPLACMIAAKASHRRYRKYALMSLLFSYERCSVDLVDLDPRFATEHLGVSVSRFIYNQIHLAHAIVAAYSTIEELGLEIRATRQKPSTLNGAWNPQVRQDLEERLTSAGIDLAEPARWTIRGTPTRIERKRRKASRQRMSYARGPYVRDREIDVADAILHSSFLRSKIASHKKGTLLKSLTPYDVISVQELARRLLLESIGFWPPLVNPDSPRIETEPANDK